MYRKTNTEHHGWLTRLLPGGIQARLYLLIALALLPLLILLGWITYQRYETRRDQALQTELEVARGLATTLAAYVEGVQQHNYGIGQAIITDTSYSAEDTTHLLAAAAAHYPAVRNLSWVSPEGIVLVSSLADLEGRDLSFRAYFQKILSGQDWAIGDLSLSGVATNAPTLAIATAIRDGHGSLTGVVTAGIEPTRLGELIFTQQRPADGAFTIFDRQGVVVYISQAEPLTWEERTRWLGGDPLLQQVLQAGQEQAGVVHLAEPGGEWVAARVPIAGTGWVAGAGRPLNVVLAPVQGSLAFDSLTALLVWLLALVPATFLARTIARPLRRLELDVQAMDAVSRESQPDPQAPIEVRRVRRAVEKMAASLMQRARALQESEERFRVLFDNRHSPMLLIDPTTTQIVDANPAASSYYGWSREELVAMKITDINTLPPGQVHQKIGQAQTSETSTRFEFKHRLASGEIRDVEVNSGPIQIGEKEYLFSILHDITERKRIEAEAEEGKRLLDALMVYVPEGITIADAPEVKIRMVSRYGQETLGLPHQMISTEEVVGQRKVYHPDGITEMADEDLPLVRAIQKGETVRDMELIQINAAGESLSLLCNAAPILSTDGEITGGIVAWRDITERKRVEKDLQAANQRITEILESIQDVFYSVDRNWIFTYANQKAADIWGKQREDLIGQHIWEIFPEAVGSYSYDQLHQVMQERQVRHFENVSPVIHSWIEVHAYPSADGGLTVYLRDIGERKRYEESLRFSEERFNKAFNASPNAQVISHLEDGLIHEINNGFERMFGYKREEVIGKTSLELNMFADPADRHEAVLRLQKEKSLHDFELQILTKTGEVRQASLSIELFSMGSGTQMLTIISDITERKRAEEALQQAHKRAAWLARFPDENPNPVIRVAAIGRVLYINPAAEQLPGWKCKVGQLLPNPLKMLVDQAIAQEQEVVQDIQTDEKFYSISVMPFPKDAYANLYGSDITERKLAEEALRESNAHIRDILESISDAFYSLDLNWRFTYVNHKAANQWRMKPEELLGRNIWEIFPTGNDTESYRFMQQAMEEKQVHQYESYSSFLDQWLNISLYPTDRGLSVYFQDITQRKKAEEALQLSEARLRRLVEANIIGVVTRDTAGQIKDANDAFLKMTGYSRDDLRRRELSTHTLVPVEYRPQENRIVDEVVSTGSSRPIETEYIRKDGRRVPILIGYTRLEGSANDFIGFVLDLSELKQTQAALAEFSEKLKQSNQELEQFAFIASHDLQEPLRKIEVFGDLLRTGSTGLDEEQRDHLSRMRQAAARMRRMITDLLELSRVNTQPQAFERVNLSEVAAEAVNDLEILMQGIGGQVEIGDLPGIEADPSQMRRLFQNLIGNALKYHKPDGLPYVRVYTEKVAPGFIEIRVKDNGIGFDESQVERIFQPFQRLVGKSEYEGSGMGLAICRKIVERHHGSITARSTPGEGSEFFVTFPLKQPAGG